MPTLPATRRVHSTWASNQSGPIPVRTSIASGVPGGSRVGSSTPNPPPPTSAVRPRHVREARAVRRLHRTESRTAKRACRRHSGTTRRRDPRGLWGESACLGTIMTSQQYTRAVAPYGCHGSTKRLDFVSGLSRRTDRSRRHSVVPLGTKVNMARAGRPVREGAVLSREGGSERASFPV